MAKIVWKTTPKAAYEWVEVEGGGSMTHAELVAFQDEYIAEHGLVPVESEFIGEAPRHKYGRYKATGTAAQALAPAALPAREADLSKANDELEALKAENARLLSQLEKKEAKGGAEVVGSTLIDAFGSSGRQTTDDARDTLNQQGGVDIEASGQEVREDMGTDDRSDDNPVAKRGRSKKVD